MVVGKALLRTIPLLSSLSDSQLDAIRMCSRAVAHGGNVVLFQEGDPGDYLFLVISGRVKVSLLGEEGKEIVLSILGPTSFLGEMALLDGAPRSATAMTLEKSDVGQMVPPRFPRLGARRRDPSRQGPRASGRLLAPGQ